MGRLSEGEKGVKPRALLEVYQRNVVVRFEGCVEVTPMSSGSGRGTVDGLSAKSARRLSHVLWNPGEGVEPWRSVWCLTYPRKFPTDGRECMRHLKALEMRARRWFGDELRAVWVKEWQKRGAMHFHVLTNVVMPHELLARWWNEIVAPGDEDHRRAGTSVKAPRDCRAYLLKCYLEKGAQKVPPEGFERPGRMWGTWGKLGEAVEVHELTPGEGKQIKRVVRKAVERRRRRPLPHSRDRAAEARGITGFGMAPEAQRLVKLGRRLDKERRARGAAEEAMRMRRRAAKRAER